MHLGLRRDFGTAVVLSAHVHGAVLHTSIKFTVFTKAKNRMIGVETSVGAKCFDCGSFVESTVEFECIVKLRNDIDEKVLRGCPLVGFDALKKLEHLHLNGESIVEMVTEGQLVDKMTLRAKIVDKRARKFGFESPALVFQLVKR